MNSATSYFSNCNDAVPSGNVLDFTVGYNAGGSDNGNVVTWSAVGNQTFSRSYVYDALNRIQSMSDSANGQACKGLSFTIDAWGDLTGQTNTGGTCYSFQAAVGTNNQLQTGNQYDAAGNMYYDLSHHYGYDAENRIIQVDSGSTASYVYNENGKRVRKNVGSGWSEFFYGPNGSVQSEYNGSFPAEYIYVGSKLIAEYTNSTTEFVHTDHLGSTRLLTGVNQAVLDNMDYSPFGQQTAGGTGTTHKFTGKERDTESGNDHFGARYYASSNGRWLSPDKPFADQHANNPQSWNLYEYGRNNPLRNVDPNGFKVLQAYVAEAVAKMQAMQGHGTFYLDFAGIQGLHSHESITASSFDKWHSDHSAANAEVVPNKGILSGFFRAFFGLANKDQVDTGKAIVAASPAGVNIAFDTYSNGVNAAGRVAQGMSSGDLESATVVGPNANSPAPVQAMDQADEDTTQIYISINDPALALALFGSQAADDWTAEFGDRVHVTDQPSHNLDQYRGAQGKAPWPGFCPAEFASCN